jgi:hypothetical protein
MAEGVTPKELDIELHDRVPDGQWEIVDVVFPATAGADFQIPHSLSPASPEQVEYTVLRQATPGTVYEDRSSTRAAWNPGYIVLRSDTASWTGRLLLRVLKSSLLWTPGQSIVYTPPVGVVYPIALNKGGTGADLSATGPGYLKQASLGSVVSVASSIPAGDIGSGQVALARGGTNADLSATGGAGQFLKQKTAGGNVAVEAIAASELGSGTGSSSNFLRGDLAWAVPSHPDFGAVSVYKSANDAAFTRETDVAIGFDSENFDTHGYHDNSSNNSRLTIPTGQSGTYVVSAYINTNETTAWGGSWHYLWIRKGGSTKIAGWQFYYSSHVGSHHVVAVLALNATEYIEAVIKESGGPNPGTRYVLGGDQMTLFSAVRVL